MNTSEKQLKSLSILHGVAACVQLTLAAPLLYIGTAAVWQFISMHKDPGWTADPREALTSWSDVALILTVLIAILLCCVAWVTAGILLWKSKSRTSCLVIAVLSCLFFPLGTLLGTFTLIMLNRESIESLLTNPRMETS